MHQPCLACGELWVLGHFVVLGPWARPLAPLSLSLVILQVGVTTWLLCTKGHHPGPCTALCPGALCYAPMVLSSSFRPVNICGGPPVCRAGAPGFTGQVCHQGPMMQAGMGHRSQRTALLGRRQGQGEALVYLAVFPTRAPTRACVFWL